MRRDVQGSGKNDRRKKRGAGSRSESWSKRKYCWGAGQKDRAERDEWEAGQWDADTKNNDRQQDRGIYREVRDRKQDRVMKGKNTDEEQDKGIQRKRRKRKEGKRENDGDREQDMEGQKAGQRTGQRDWGRMGTDTD